MFLILDLKEQGEAVAYISIQDENISYKVRKDLKFAESVFIEISMNIFKKNRNIILLHKNSIKAATLIDNIYTNSTNWETSTNGILHSDLIIGTDHKAIFTIIPNTDIPNPPIYRTQRDVSLKNVTKLKKSYTKKNWTDLYMIKSIQETFTYFIGFITQTFYDCCPEKNTKNKI